MNELKNRQLTGFSQHLRKNMTKEEKLLWYRFLKFLPCTFHRQKVMGSYIADFYCAEKKIIIELDGSQHYTDEGSASDRVRDRSMADEDITVLRYTNLQVNRCFDAVCRDILNHIDPDGLMQL